MVDLLVPYAPRAKRPMAEARLPRDRRMQTLPRYIDSGLPEELR